MKLAHSSCHLHSLVEIRAMMIIYSFVADRIPSPGF